jgi:hypothetical protein
MPRTTEEKRQRTDHLVALAVRLHSLVHAAEGGPQVIGPEQRGEVEDLVLDQDAHDLAVHAPGAAAAVCAARRLLDVASRRPGGQGGASPDG